MHYSVVNANPKVISIVSIASKNLSLQDILSVAAKEFPSLSFDQLIITPSDNPYIVYLQQKHP